jgi:hypothetical protein
MNVSDADAETALGVTCPRCAAEPGERCLTKASYAFQIHAARAHEALGVRHSRHPYWLVCQRLSAATALVPYDHWADVVTAAHQRCDRTCNGTHVVCWADPAGRIRARGVNAATKLPLTHNTEERNHDPTPPRGSDPGRHGTGA